jgi:hypothetical protein
MAGYGVAWAASTGAAKQDKEGCLLVMYVPLPMQREIHSDDRTYRLNVWAIAHLSGLDTTRLQAYRKAVKAGLYSEGEDGKR